ncbi:putative nuclear hormone receptor HR38 [Trichinella spiralis]|uniref:putative nuclear hormone receptor HR38 n=1 Tax=Trichinella spiralis TaxID=6334 RepID=UPI0001EFECDE|nr:putative nuclear hormone receptor HR38 [Trichinella spiralis]
MQCSASIIQKTIRMVVETTEMGILPSTLENLRDFDVDVPYQQLTLPKFPQDGVVVIFDFHQENPGFCEPSWVTPSADDPTKAILHGQRPVGRSSNATSHKFIIVVVASRTVARRVTEVTLCKYDKENCQRQLL